MSFVGRNKRREARRIAPICVGKMAQCASAFALRASADSWRAVARAASVGGSLIAPYALLAGFMLAGSAHAHSHKLKSLEIVHPWCWETAAGTKTVAVYMTIRNNARRPDRLLRATASIADKAELRAGGADTAAKSFDAKPGGELILKRDGPHILLTGVKRQLSPYDAFVLTLTFERAGRVEVEVAVEEAKAEPAKH